MNRSNEMGVAVRANGSVVGGVAMLLRLEGLALFLAATTMFGLVHGHWSLYAWLFLSPDLSLAFYLAGPKAGAIAYNALHSSIGALLLGLAGYMAGVAAVGPIALIWLAHIGFDRAAGFGLKYASAFGDTHLGLQRR
jgi:hypothetical protein